MSTQRTDVLLPVGRFVSGSMTLPSTKDADGNPLVIKRGAQAGQPREDWFFAVAIPKAGAARWQDTEWGKVIYATGLSAFPQHAESPTFSWKITDGDSTTPNGKGKKPCDREGFPGNFIVHLSSGFAPYTFNASGSAVEPAEAIKPGHFVEVLATVAGNGSTQNPGVYLNHSMVAHSAFGPEINLGKDPESVGFGKAALPAGATSAPASAGFPPFASSVAAPPPPPPLGAAVPTVPHPTILAGPPPAPPAAPKHVMLPAAGGVAYEAFIVGGWTDDQLVANGMMQS